MYPFGSLPGNLVAFCGVLRRDHGFRIGPAEAFDAARALEIVDLRDECAVRNALRPILSMTVDNARVFDPAFDAFFYPKTAGFPPSNLHVVARDVGIDAIALDVGATGQGPRSGSSGYSPLGVEAAGESPCLTPVDAAWRDAARALVRRLHAGLSRRWRPRPRGTRFDLRRTLRASLQTGGQPLTARWLRRPPRRPRIVLVIDGSRSMGVYAETALQIALALATATMRLEVFTFSTALQRVTEDVRRAAGGDRCRLEFAPYAWAGGTSIGGCLQDFLRRFGGRLVGRDTLLMIASDGLDVGAVATLTDAMRQLHRRSASVVWLNPLLETEGYEPTASGMRAARPFIHTFAWVNDAADLRRLARALRLRPVA
jgi:uncharacterized protein with von Willebrand factor type A (vWA) domain